MVDTNSNSPRTLVALVPSYAGLRIGETVGLDLDDIRVSTGRGLLVVRAGEGDRSVRCGFAPTFGW